ncbi:MAG: hypothetical protein HKP40_05105 [Litoreibacter sp.]|nr:hypothetical protein [Litoreibacter sp.]
MNRSDEKFGDGQAQHTIWSASHPQSGETHLDPETAILLRCHVHAEFASSASWVSLLDNLADKGFHLEFQDERLMLINSATDRAVCACRDLGFDLEELTGRMGKPRVAANTRKVVLPLPGYS